MEKSNIIISVIVVLCIAAGVTAYGLSNPDDNIFSNLAGLDGGGSDGLGNNTTRANSTSGTGSGSASSGSGQGSSSTPSTTSKPKETPKTDPKPDPRIREVKDVANTFISEPGCYAGNPVEQPPGWYVPVLNSAGNVVDGLYLVKVDGNWTSSRA
jgi:hypothetical protein